MFQGFSDKTIDFMWGIRFNNEKTWFEAQMCIRDRSSTQGAQAQADTAQNDIQYFFHPSSSSRRFSRLVSMTCRMAATGWTKSIRGPEKRITSRIFSRISGL